MEVSVNEASAARDALSFSCVLQKRVVLLLQLDELGLHRTGHGERKAPATVDWRWRPASAITRWPPKSAFTRPSKVPGVVAKPESLTDAREHMRRDRVEALDVRLAVERRGAKGRGDRLPQLRADCCR